jgi:acetyltransferase
VKSEAVKEVPKISRSLPEYEAKKLLSAYGISTTAEELAHDSAEAIKLSRSIGYPVALKISSKDIPHKTEAGGIVLGISSDLEVEEAYQKILDNVRKYKPGSVIEGVLVQEMAGPGAEVILGVSSEPGIGPVILFGLGGIFVEVFKDVTLRVARFMDHETAQEMVREIKGYSILKGARGQKPCDTDAIVETIVKLARFAMAYRDSIDQIDINPLRVFEQGKGVKVVDALIMLHENIVRGNSDSTARRRP